MQYWSKTETTESLRVWREWDIYPKLFLAISLMPIIIFIVVPIGLVYYHVKGSNQ